MRKKIIFLGIIVLIIGFLLFIYGSNHYNYYKQYSEKSYIEIPNTFSKTESESQMTFGTIIIYIGFFTLFISAFLIAIGFYLKKN